MFSKQDFLTKTYIFFQHYSLQSSDLLNRFITINNYKNYNLCNWNYASQWSILNRNITKFILDNETEFNMIFSKSKYPDEYKWIDENNNIHEDPYKRDLIILILRVLHIHINLFIFLLVEHILYLL